MKQFTLSVVIPVYNEEGSIEPLLKRLLAVVKAYKYEIVFVNDGSKDHTVEKIKEHTAHNANIKLLSFNRNFGHQLALVAGYTVASGDCVVSIDADLQDPPEIIADMVEKWLKGAKIVYAKRKKRDVDSAFKKITARLFYRFIGALSETEVPDNVGDFRLLDKEVVDLLKTLPEHSPFLRGLVAWTGYPSDYVYFDREERTSGTTHYSFTKMLDFALDGITSFSARPLRIASYIGFITAFLGFIGIVYAIVGRFLLPIPWVTGWSALFVGIMFFGGVQLITIGIIGEYIGKIYIESLNRPHYLIKEKVNL
ncbi:glycosyltransferase family 2 protein [Candidatus Woesebacteria bacterium]|nr:glycosyltransferase family 2 protein [Candidatus Woesebacteria bacterium]